MKDFIEKFFDWALGKRCPIHGYRPDGFTKCIECWSEKIRAEDLAAAERKREARVAEIEAGVTRALVNNPIIHHIIKDIAREAK